MTSQGYKKMSVELPWDDFDRVADRLHHGMLAAVVRQFFRSLGYKIDQEGVHNLYQWLDNKENLELTPVKELEDDRSERG